MTMLVLETFILMLVLVALGVFMGAGARVMLVGGPSEAAADIGTPPPAEDHDHADEANLVAAVNAAVSDVDAPMPPPVDPVVVPAKEFVIDAGKAAIADQTGVRPPALAGPRNAKADDLKQIKGIGPQNEARLNALGIYHFDQIAGWTQEEIRWVGSYLAFPGRIEREGWILQASELDASR